MFLAIYKQYLGLEYDYFNHQQMAIDFLETGKITESLFFPICVYDDQTETIVWKHTGYREQVMTDKQIKPYLDEVLEDHTKTLRG